MAGLEYDMGTFIIYYMSRRIADEPHWPLIWHEAPYCMEDNPPETWQNIEKGCRLIEKRNHSLFDEAMLFGPERIPIRHREFLRGLSPVFDRVRDKWGKRYATLWTISMIGRFARHLAEADATRFDDERHYRTEIHQVSLFGYLTLHAKWVRAGAEHWLNIEEDANQMTSRIDKIGWAWRIFSLSTLTGGLASLGYFIYRRFAA